MIVKFGSGIDNLYVDSFNSLPAIGNQEKVYITKDTEESYRWTGTSYVQINNKATKLVSPRLITFIGDITGQTIFDGSSDANINITLATIGNLTGTYNTATTIVPITLDNKGRVTNIGNPVTISPSWVNVTNKPTTLAGLNLTDLTGPAITTPFMNGIASIGNSTTYAKADHIHPSDSSKLSSSQTLSLSGDITSLATALNSGTINTTLSNTGVSAGTYGTNVFIPQITVDSKGRITNITTLSLGNAPTATKLQTARLINGVSFDGTTDITISAVDINTPRIASSEKGAPNGVPVLDNNSHIGLSYLDLTVVSKTVDQNFTSNVLSNLNELVVPLLANAVYEIECFVTFTSTNTNCGFAIGLSTPSGSINTVEITVPIVSEQATSQLRVITPSAAVATNLGSVVGSRVTATNSPHTGFIKGIVSVGNTAGDLKIKGASELNKTTTTVKAGSILKVNRIA